MKIYHNRSLDEFSGYDRIRRSIAKLTTPAELFLISLAVSLISTLMLGGGF